MILWEYQDCGFNRYRYVAVGTTCEGCTALDGQIFSIDEAEPGVNFGTLHPHCDCKTEILDANGNAVYTISSVKKEEKQKKSDDSLKQYNFLSSYLGKSLRQLLMGNFTEDVTLLGTALQVIAGLLDLDLPLDLRDLAYDLTHWENTPKHIAQTAMDFLALLPVIGSLKYSDEVSAVLKTAAKHGDEAADVAKAATKHADEAADAAKAATKHADEAADAAKGATKEGKALQNAADALIDGKVAGKIPLEEYEAIRKRSVKNAASDTLTLGKYAADETSYTVRAGKTSYFDLGDEWDAAIKKYDLTDDDMFKLFNEPVLKDALEQGKTIRFSHNPLEYSTAIRDEWEYIKAAANLDDTNLVFEGGFWYVKK